MDDLPSPLNLTDDELLEVRKFALAQAVDTISIYPTGASNLIDKGIVPSAIAFERFLVFGDAGESK